jgi:hypothetical protein
MPSFDGVEKQLKFISPMRTSTLETEMATNSDRATRLVPDEPGCPKENAIRVSEHVRTTHGADGAIVLDILHGQMFRLNFVGSRILELFEQRSTEAEIAEHLGREFGIDRATIEADVRELVETLLKHHLLIPSPALE